ncbi:MAG: ribonuclease III [Clostridia bacterium]|nr:ribonuclease III [Clostridia bacterium]
MAIGKDLGGLQEALGYTFADPTYLQTALTHASYSHEQKGKGKSYPSNERLEFLGDAVLQLVISDELFRMYGHFAEGALTKTRQTLVCEKTLSSIAASIDLGAYLHVGHGEEMTDCRCRPKVLADAMEAVFAAVYLDARATGSDAYRTVILRLLHPMLTACMDTPPADAKTMLQQLVEKDGSSVLTYEVLREDGPAHEREYTVACYVNNNEVGRGCARTIKDAQMEAATVALRLFGVL